MELKTKNTIVSLVSTLIVIIVAVVIALIMVTNSNDKPSEAKAQKPESERVVNSKTVDYSSYPVVVSAYGRLKALNKIDIYSEVQGLLNSSNFKTGNSFNKGDILLSVDERQVKLDLKSSKSNFLSTLSSMMADIKSDYPSEFDKWNSFVESISLDENLPDLPKINSSKEKYFISTRKITNTYYTVKNLELRLSKHQIQAPFSGVVTDHFIEKGALINPGQKLGQFATLNQFELELSVDAKDAQYLFIGSEVRLLDESTSKEYFGKLRRIARNIDPKSQTIKCYVNINNKDLKDGMYLRGDVNGKEIKDVFKVKRSALVNNSFMHIINDGLLDKVNVSVVRLSEDYAFVNGIDSGLTVITEALANVGLGSKVRSLDGKK